MIDEKLVKEKYDVKFLKINDPLQLIKYLVIERKEISHLRCHKLLYFAYKKALLENGTFLFREEFEAWKYGPVLRSYYAFFKKFEEDTETDRLEDFLEKKIENEVELEKEMVGAVSVKKLLDNICEEYKNYDTYELIEISHDKYWKKAERKMTADVFLGS